MNNTPYFGYNLPQPNDVADISKINANFTNLDAFLHRTIGEDYDNADTLDERVEVLEQGGASATLSKIATNHFADGIDSYTKSLEVSIALAQTGSDVPSPTNVRAITGFTECTVNDNGKNLFSNTATSTTKNGVTLTVNSDRTVTLDGTATANSYFIIGNITLTAGTYTLNGCPSGGSKETYLFYTDNPLNATDIGQGATITATETQTVNAVIVVYNGYTANNLIFKPMIRLASDTDATYEEYKTPTTATISFGTAGTVYGGTVDLISGNLTVDRAMVDWATVGIQKNWASADNYLYYLYSGISPDFGGELICSHLPQTAGMPSATLGVFPSSQYSVIYINFLDAIGTNTVEGFRQYCINNDVQLVYPLATPETYQLTGTQLRTLVGENYLSANTGEVTEIEYITNTTVSWLLDLIIGGN